jgi:hypothetical protein
VITWDEFLDRLQDRFADLPSIEILLFEVGVIVAGILTYRFLAARIEHVRGHLLLIALGMFLVEFFTGPMWTNQHLGPWAYVYSDVSWILTIGWTVLISLSIYVVERVLRAKEPWKRYVLFLLIITPVTIMCDGLVRGLGIRESSPETAAAAGSAMFPIIDVPVAGLYYVPVVMTLVYSFCKHWLPAIEPGAATAGRLPFLNRLLLTTVAVVLFEIVVEPMATNQNFPAWSYVFHDITVIMTGLWVLIVTVSTLAVDRFLRTTDVRLKFAAYLTLITLIAAPIEAWFIQNGYRVYGPSATADFIGLRTVILDLPIEVLAAIPLYLSLVISFVRYWDGSVDRSLGFRPREAGERARSAPSVAPPVAGRP